MHYLKLIFATLIIFGHFLVKGQSNTDLVIEGTVIEKISFWNSEKTRILTKNIVQLKNKNKSISIITKGGIIGDQFQFLVHEHKFTIGQHGIFHLNRTPEHGGFTTNRVLKTFTAIKTPIIQESKNSQIPLINSFSPDTITAGTGDYLTIKGSGFGIQDSLSSVSFQNANSDQLGWIEVYENDDITTWNDTLITVLVAGQMQNTSPAGSGRVIVSNSQGSATSVDELEIRFSRFNIRFMNDLTIEYPVEMKRMNPTINDFGFTWKVSQELNDLNPLAFPIIEDAINQWQCETNIAWEVDPNLDPNNVMAIDSINRIYLAPPSDFSNPSFIAETFLTGRLGICSGLNIIYINEIDIGISNDSIYGFALGNAPIPPNKADFYGVILHELGHSLLLGHAHGNTKIMFPTIPDGSNAKRVLSTADIEGVEHLIQTSQANLGMNGCPKGINTKDCIIDAVTESVITSLNIEIYPNPFSDKITVRIDSKESLIGKLSIYNILGQSVINQMIDLNTGENIIEFSEKSYSLVKGTYFVSIETERGTIATKIIKH